MTKKNKFPVLVVLVMSVLLLFLFVGIKPPPLEAQGSEPELVLFLAGSSDYPFLDLSTHHNAVILQPDLEGDQVGTVFDPVLGRDVFTFANGGFLEIPDLYNLLKLTSVDEMTIEICFKLTDTDPGYICEVENQPPAVVNPPDQMILCKGNQTEYSYIRNYSVHFGWGRDDMMTEYCDSSVYTAAYIPGFSFGSGGMTSGFDSPMPNNSAELAGWRIYSFLMRRSEEDPDMFLIDCYVDRYPGSPCPVMISSSDLDSQVDNSSLFVGNGFTTGGCVQCFTDIPFYGQIDYIRVYRGLLPLVELNDSPTNPVPFPAMNQAPVAVCKTGISLEANGDCLADIVASDVDGGSNDPDGDQLILSINPQGPFSAGEHSVILTASDGELSDSCETVFTVTDVTPPELQLFGPVQVNIKKGKKANQFTVVTYDNCSMEIAVDILDVQVFNGAGKRVKGKGIYSIQDDVVLVYPNGKNWTLSVEVAAQDESGNSTVETLWGALEK